MKIFIQRLQEGVPKSVREEYNPKELGLEFVDLTYSEGVSLNGTVEKFNDALTFSGNLTSQVERTCARCLKVVGEAVDHPFQMVYDIQGKEELDTTEDIREMLILNHPIRFLCNENCAGLCPTCGINLNEGVCSCLRKS